MRIGGIASSVSTVTTFSAADAEEGDEEGQQRQRRDGAADVRHRDGEELALADVPEPQPERHGDAAAMAMASRLVTRWTTSEVAELAGAADAHAAGDRLALVEDQVDRVAETAGAGDAGAGRAIMPAPPGARAARCAAPSG